MGMRRSPHRKRKSPLPVSTRTSGSYRGEGIWLPLGHRAGMSAKHASGNEPGKTFRDPQGRLHVVPDKRKRNKQKTRGN